MFLLVCLSLCGVELSAYRVEQTSTASRLFGRTGRLDAYASGKREVCLRLGNVEAFLSFHGQFRKASLEL